MLPISREFLFLLILDDIDFDGWLSLSILELRGGRHGVFISDSRPQCKD